LLISSLRFRLTLWYSLTLAVVLAASGMFWYFYLSREIYHHIRERLVIVAEDVATFHQLNHGDSPPESSCSDLLDYIRRRNFGEYIQILNSRGSIVCTSENLQNFRLPLNKRGLQHVLEGTPYFETVYDLGPRPVRLLTFPVTEENRIDVLIQVGEDLTAGGEVLNHLQLLLLGFSPFAMIILTFGGWFLAGRAVTPMVRITSTMRKINAENLYQRLPVPEGENEIARLAETFNSMLARLEGSFQRIKQFSGDASHELRTPLTILRGETEVALRWAKSKDEYRQILQSNMEEIDRMGRIIENLLLLAKSESGEMSISIKELSLSDLLQELYLQAKSLGDPKQIDVRLNLKVSEEIQIRGDELRLRQMFLNLISNGIKYTPSGGKLTLGLAVEGEQVLVTVADTGIGIPEEHLPHIFSRFYRVDEARNREDGGAGLGLAIVKWIVKIHDGKIDVDSMPNQGTTFTVLLPLDGPKPRQIDFSSDRSESSPDARH